VRSVFAAQKRYTPNAFSITAIYVIATLLWAVTRYEILIRSVSNRSELYGFYFFGETIFVGLSSVAIYLITRYYNAAAHTVLEGSVATAQALFESAAQGIVIADRNGTIISANPQLLQVFGYEREELLGQPIERMLPERLREVHVAHRDNYFKSPRPRPMGLGFDLTARRKDGTEFPVEVSLSSFESGRGRLAIAFITDISERLKLEHETRRSEKLVTLGAISAGIAHELNNPIGIISSRIELMLEDAGSRRLPAEVEEDLHVLHRNALRVGTIAKGLLTLARHRPKQRHLVDLNAEIDEVLLLVGKQMSKDDIQLSTQLDRTLAPIIGDSVAMQEVLLNLLMNAREAMPGGGAVRIETGSVAGQPGWIQLAVTDNGPGIPAEVIPRLFDPFYTQKTSGTGLGLWISKRIVRDHRGTIEVQSQPGQGTSFIMTFPGVTETKSSEGSSDGFDPPEASRQRNA
jgi:PAS domain S-box-containing protein